MTKYNTEDFERGKRTGEYVGGMICASTGCKHTRIKSMGVNIAKAERIGSKEFADGFKIAILKRITQKPVKQVPLYEIFNGKGPEDIPNGKAYFQEL